MRIPYLLWLLLAFPAAVWSQPDTIKLTNPSFEDEPRMGAAPQGWLDGGFENETPPDVQPGFFNCTRRPRHGNTYLGLVTRDNYTWERVAQYLSSPLLKNNVYEFSICLATSPYYISLSRMHYNEVNYTGPVQLRIWAGTAEHPKMELLAETSGVPNTDWKKFECGLKPRQQDYNWITLEAGYALKKGATYNGNLLLDACSKIERSSM